jgi:carboxylesterase type B
MIWFTGKAHHGVDLLYVFLTYQSHLPSELATLAENMASYWLSFVRGDKPWTVYDQKPDGSSKIMVFGPNGRNAENMENSKPAYKNLLLCAELKEKIGRLAASLHGRPAEV